MRKITFEDLVKASPELSEIREDSQGWYQRYNRWQSYESLKFRMKKCVGKYAEGNLPEFMYTMQAYDVAHQEIFKNGQDFIE